MITGGAFVVVVAVFLIMAVGTATLRVTDLIGADVTIVTNNRFSRLAKSIATGISVGTGITVLAGRGVG